MDFTEWIRYDEFTLNSGMILMTAPSNWQKYLDLLSHKGIPEHRQRWYVKRVEDFLKQNPGKRLPDFSASDLEAYFQRQSHNVSLNAWQYQQMVDALQLLFVDLSATALAKTVDWGYWKEAYVEYTPVKEPLSKEIPPEVVAAQYSAVKFPSGSGSNDVLTATARLIRSRTSLG